MFDILETLDPHQFKFFYLGTVGNKRISWGDSDAELGCKVVIVGRGGIPVRGLGVHVRFKFHGDQEIGLFLLRTAQHFRHSGIWFDFSPVINLN